MEDHGVGSKIPNVDYDPIKAPPPPIRRSKPQLIESADMMIVACRMDLDNQVLFWRFLDRDSISYIERDGKLTTITRNPTNGQMRLEDMAKNSALMLKEMYNK
jgi:hypothetical protein